MNDQPMKHLDQLRIPFLAMSALDDPICVPPLIPFDQFKRSRYGTLLTTNKGSHTYWLTSSFWAPHQITMWCHDVVLDFLHTVHRLDPETTAAADTEETRHSNGVKTAKRNLMPSLVTAVEVGADGNTREPQRVEESRGRSSRPLKRRRSHSPQRFGVL
jgi:hypothetical protein